MTAPSHPAVPPPSAAPGASARGGTLTPQAPRRRRWRQTRSAKGVLFAAPLAAFIVLFFIVPLITVMTMSASDWPLIRGYSGSNFPDNFSAPPATPGAPAYGVLNDPSLWPAVVFTVKYTVIVTVVMLALALGLALLVQEVTRWNSLLRTAFLIPSAVGLATASLLFYGFYTPAFGPVNPLLVSLGLPRIEFLGSQDGILWSTVVLIIWRFTGFFMLIIMVGLQGISHDVYEAARVDGANAAQMFRRITLPLLRPSLVLCLVICVTGSLLAFDHFYIISKGAEGTSTIVMLIFAEAFTRFDLGTAAALSVLVLVALVFINVFQLRVLRARD
ncbi:MAG: ABC transporter permease [Actinobacteria bacterium HGW-Actinobacteria-4]|nr:MAG: ABC transporter permease [Actinobacteria bacterium HGW-Actinobacteria-4]